MGRRPSDNAGDLRKLILKASTELIEANGLSGLSAREIARRVGYSPGTIYNVFENLDDLILTIEGQVLDQLEQRLRAVAEAPHAAAADHVRKLAAEYLRFAQDNPKLWNLLSGHQLPAGKTVPDWYRQKLDDIKALIEEALLPILQKKPDLPNQVSAFWAGIHGISALATSDKLPIAPADSAPEQVEDLVSSFLRGHGSTPGQLAN